MVDGPLVIPNVVCEFYTDGTLGIEVLHLITFTYLLLSYTCDMLMFNRLTDAASMATAELPVNSDHQNHDS